MFRFSNFFRDARRRTVLLTVMLGVSLLAGCRNTGRPSAVVAPAAPPMFSDVAVPSSVPPPILLGTDATISPLPDSLQAFRPITPEPLFVPESTTPTVSETPPPVFQKTIDDLNDKVAELERKLADKDAELKHALLPTPIPETPKPLSAVPLPMAKAPPALPTISINGVSSSVDGENVRIRIPDAVLFQPGTMRLTANGEEAIRNIAAEIRTKYPNAALEIEGHTDNLLTDPTNATQKHDAASLKSMVVLQYFLQALQWAPETIATSGYGSSRPVADNGTPEGRAQNNLIEIVVKGEGNRE